MHIPKTSEGLFPGFGSTKDTAAAATMADGALKASEFFLFFASALALVVGVSRVAYS